MATVYSDAYWTGAYTYTRVKVEYSGTSATAILLYTRTNTYAGATRAGNASFGFGGGSADMSWKTFYGQQTDAEICRCSFTISTSGGWYSGSTSGDAGMLAFSGGVSIPAQTSKPSGLSVSLAESYTNGGKFNVTLSSYGVPSGESGRYIEAGIMNHNTYGPTYRFAFKYATKSSSITVNNSSNGTLNIQPNTRYYYGAYASNTALAINKVQGQFVTKAEAPTVLFNSATPNTANLSYSVRADGGVYNRSIQYSLNNGITWITATTVTGGTAQSGTFIVSGLLAGASHNMRVRISTTAGTTEGEAVEFNTLPAEEDGEILLYGSANDEAKKVQILYGEVSNESKLITKFYGPANDPDNFRANIVHTESSQRWGIDAFSPSIFKSKMLSDHPTFWAMRNNFAMLEARGYRNTDPRRYDLTLRLKNNGVISLVSGGNSTMMSAYGVHTTSLSPYAANTLDFVYLNPQLISRLIHQGFGHINYEVES